jgi:hypothetical protein
MPIRLALNDVRVVQAVQAVQARRCANRCSGPVSERACRDMSVRGSRCPASRLGRSRIVNRSARTPRVSSSSHSSGVATGAPVRARTEYGATAVCAYAFRMTSTYTRPPRLFLADFHGAMRGVVRYNHCGDVAGELPAGVKIGQHPMIRCGSNSGGPEGTELSSTGVAASSAGSGGSATAGSALASAMVTANVATVKSSGGNADPWDASKSSSVRYRRACSQSVTRGVSSVGNGR